MIPDIDIYRSMSGSQPRWHNPAMVFRLPLLLLLSLGAPAVQAQSTLPATVLRVIDGDTFVANVMPLPDTTREIRVRVLELDTPELRGKCPEEKQLAKAARARAAELLVGRVRLEVPEARAFDKFGRLLAHVRLEDGRYLAGVLIREGLGRAWTGLREDWCE
jgi:endonuclease YncB( thermonuclease family)